MSTDRYRELGTVDYVRVTDARGEGGTPNTIWVGVKFNGSGQGFGGLMLDAKGIEVFTEMVTGIFDVKTLEEAVGKECYALRSFGDWGADIVGLEGVVTGRKMTVNGFRRTMGYKVEGTELQMKIDRLKRDIEYHRRRAAETELDLRKIGRDYHEWDKE